MNDANIQDQVSKLILFVADEGVERSREMDRRSLAEAKESFHAALDAGKKRVDKEMGKKGKELSKLLSQQSAELSQKGRLTYLLRREKCVQELFAEALGRLVDDTEDPHVYRKLLRRLIVQALCKAGGETQVGLRVLDRDCGLIEAVLPAALEDFRKLSGLRAKIQIDGMHFLPELSLGGVQLFCRAGRVRIDNTLGTRFSQLRRNDGFLVFVGACLFGTNPRRKFLD